MNLERSLIDCISVVKQVESLEGREDVINDNNNAILGSISKNCNSFILNMNKAFIEQQTDKNENINNYECNASYVGNIKIKSSLLTSTNYYDSSEYSVSQFSCPSSHHENVNGCYRLIMHHNKLNMRLHDYFDNVSTVTTEMDRKIRNAVEVTVGPNNFISYFSGKYFVIETCVSLAKDVFIESCRAIITGLSFVTGYAPGDYAFIFCFENNHFINHIGYEFNSSFTKTANSSSYSLINSNIYNYCNELGSEERDLFVKKERQNFKGMSKISFSKLCGDLISFSNFSEAVYAIIEARCSSLTSMGILYSVSLESLSGMFLENKDNAYYIENKSERKKFRKYMEEAAKEYFLNNLDVAYDPSPIKAKVDNITAPTNRDKLLLPFESLSIPLAKDDHIIINKRNDFLHGNGLYDVNGTLDSNIRDLWNTALRLSFLANSIVLKYVGHSGKVGNPAGLLNAEHHENQPKYREL